MNIRNPKVKDKKDQAVLPVTKTNVQRRFEHRLQILKKGCRQYGRSSLFNPVRKPEYRGKLGPYWPAMNTTVRYCPIEKTASTTWSHIFRRIQRHMEIRGIAQGMASSENSSDVRFFFVRDPYSRLLSAYVDKLFSPNTLFWKMTGRHIIQTFRPNATERSLRCGHDVTFPEFIRYVIHSQKTGMKRNGHFIPTHDHCDVCNKDYDYVGHLETLSEDMPYLLKKMQSPVNYTKNFENGTIINNARWVLQSMTPGIKQCMSMEEACLRLWKKWHIRGIISKTEPLPVSAETAEHVSFNEFVYLSLQALARSVSNKDRKLQKTEALREAFASVPMADRFELQQLLFLDFKLFGFDPSPETVFSPVSWESGKPPGYLDVRLT